MDQDQKPPIKWMHSITINLVEWGILKENWSQDYNISMEMLLRDLNETLLSHKVFPKIYNNEINQSIQGPNCVFHLNKPYAVIWIL
jgi:hypothetical protein